MKAFSALLLCIFALNLSAQTILTAPGLASFKKKAASGGGGGAITKIFFAAAGGTSGGCTTTPATNTIGSTLFVAAAAGYRSPYPTNYSSPANAWTTNNTVADAGSGSTVRLSYSSSPTTSSSQTFSASGGDVGTINSHVAAIGVSGATALDAEATATNMANVSTSIQVGSSVTPFQSGELFVATLRCNAVSTWSIDSGFTIDYQGTNDYFGETLVFAHKIKTDALPEQPTFTKLAGGLVDCAVVMGAYK